MTKKAAGGGGKLQTYEARDGNVLKFYTQASQVPPPGTQDGSVGAFADLVKAIKDARSFVFVADWSFQPLTRMVPRTGPGALTDTIGHLLMDVARQQSQMVVAIHTWDHTGFSTKQTGPVGAPDAQNDQGDAVLDAIAAATGFQNNKRPGNCLWRMSSRDRNLTSHHQKFVVMDSPDDPVSGGKKRVVKAFFGGLDLTKGRFDFPDSPIIPPIAAQPFGATVSAGGFSNVDDWYNAEFLDDRTMPRQAWQDFYAHVVGPAAWDVLREFVGRWNRPGDVSLFPPKGNITDAARQTVRLAFQQAFLDSNFRQQSEPHGGPFRARVVRSQAKVEWGPMILTNPVPDKKVDTDTALGKDKTQREFEWKVSGNFERSIQESYLHAIRNADRFIYIETQYLIGSGSKWQFPQKDVKNQVPEAIAQKIVERIDANRPFHAYLVIPMFPEGDPISAAAIRQRFFEFNTMRFMAQTVATAARAKGKDWRQFLSFYFLGKWTTLAPAATPALTGSRRARVAANRRYQVYVHSKLMIVDDQYVILGSANLNERSLAGDRDSELCLSMHAQDGKLEDVRKIVGDFRREIWTGHLAGLAIDINAPETTQCSDAVRAAGLNNWKAMAQGTRANASRLVHIPFNGTNNTFFVDDVNTAPGLRAQDKFLLDAATKAAEPPGNGTTMDNEWRWDAPRNSLAPLPDFLAE